MAEKFKIKKTTSIEAQRLIGLWNSSFDDYVSARILINQRKLLQGCVLANTAVEKFFKALIECRGNTIKAKHDLKLILPTIKNYAPTLYSMLNIEFLEQLSKIYESRYVGDCKHGYNIVIVKRKFIAELDYIFSILEPRIRVYYDIKNRIVKTKYEYAVEEKDMNIWNDNYILNNIDKTSFIETLDTVFELRVVEKSGQILEIYYPTITSKNDGKFAYEGLIPSEDFKSFRLSHEIYENYVTK